jgi:tripartite-type tricarboxylate transporter receptor subunit TctC
MLHICRLVLIALALALSASATFPQAYPSKPIRIVVPMGPGAAADVMARAFARYLQDRTGQAVVVENRPGANGIIGTALVRNAAADGYTFGMVTNSTHAAATFLFKDVPYDPVRDFEHVGLFFTLGTVAFVPAGSPIKSLDDLIARARAAPGQVTYAYATSGAQMPAEMLEEVAGISLQGVPYKAVAQAITDLIGGQVDFMFENYVAAAGHIAGSRVRPIAVTEAKRSRLWPHIPAVAEKFPGFEVLAFIGMCAPRGTPRETLNFMNRAIADALREPAVRAPLEKSGVVFMPLTREQYRKFLVGETQRWRDYAARAGIEPQ